MSHYQGCLAHLYTSYCPLQTQRCTWGYRSTPCQYDLSEVLCPGPASLEGTKSNPLEPHGHKGSQPQKPGTLTLTAENTWAGLVQACARMELQYATRACVHSGCDSFGGLPRSWGSVQKAWVMECST